MTQSDDPDGTDAPAVGSVAEEAAKLLGALSGWGREHGDGLHDGVSQGMSSLADELHEHLATGSPECAWCPVCRTVATLRQTSPEVKAHLTNAASSLALALSGLLATRPPGRDPGSRMERIRLDEDAADGDPDDSFTEDADS